MRIAILSHTFFPVVGGAEIGIHELASRLAKDHTVWVVTPIQETHTDSYSVSGLTIGGYGVVRYANPLLAGRWGRFGGWFARLSIIEGFVIWRLKRRCGLDVVNVHFTSPFSLAAPLLRYVLRIPVVLSLVGRPAVLAEHSGIRRALSRIALGAANSTTEISSYCSQGSWAEGILEVLSYGADIETYSPESGVGKMRSAFAIPSDRFVLLAVQRLQFVKRVDLVLQMFSIVQHSTPDAHLVIVGKGEEESELRTLALRMRLRNVHFAGYVDESELPSFYAESDIFVSHSENETFGVMFAQAMASGLPIVAARTSCIPDVVEDGENGLLFAAGDVDAFAASVLQLMDSPAWRARMASAGVAKAQTVYSWDVAAERLGVILSQAL